MARSKRKTPVIPITNARSEKEDKRRANRTLRRRSREQLPLMDSDVAEIRPLPVAREVSDIWVMAKDGKQRFSSQKHPEWMRK